MSHFTPFHKLPNNLGFETVHASELAKAKELVTSCLNLITKYVPQFMSQRGWIAAQGFSLKAIESCEATLILVDKGMAGAAWSTLRTAWECLFYAAALWRNPTQYQELNAAHNKERLTQAKALYKAMPSILSPESVSKLKSLTQDLGSYQKWPCFNAAMDAGLNTEYELIYRGCGLAGAHATERSLDRYFMQPEGAADDEFVLVYSPNFDISEIQISWTIHCLNKVMNRFQAHLTAVSGNRV